MKLLLDTRISCCEGLSFGRGGTASIFFKEKKNVTYIHLILFTQFWICTLGGLKSVLWELHAYETCKIPKYFLQHRPRKSLYFVIFPVDSFMWVFNLREAFNLQLKIIPRLLKPIYWIFRLLIPLSWAVLCNSMFLYLQANLY